MVLPDEALKSNWDKAVLQNSAVLYILQRQCQMPICSFQAFIYSSPTFLSSSVFKTTSEPESLLGNLPVIVVFEYFFIRTIHSPFIGNKQFEMSLYNFVVA